MDLSRDLLFGLLACQEGLLESTTLVDVIRGWVGNKHASLCELILNRVSLSVERREQLFERVQELLIADFGNVATTTRRLINDSAINDLRKLGDTDLNRCLPEITSNDEVPETVREIPSIRRRKARYTLGGEIGKGGGGTVFEARDAKMDRTVAYKQLPAKTARRDKNSTRRFRREARLTGRLDHPNIVPIYDLGARGAERLPFYTMKRINGRSFDKAISEHHERKKSGQDDPISLRVLVRAFIQVCNAVGFANSKGVVHRDLKPLNVVVGSFGEVYVIDWGEARDLMSQQKPNVIQQQYLREGHRSGSLTTPFSGTPRYMAPEQADSKLEQINHLTDVYGLGSMLFHILTGEPPHRWLPGEDRKQHLPDLLRRIINDPTPRVRDTDPSIAESLDDICAKAMAKQPATRFSSAGELAAAVQSWLDEAPILHLRHNVELHENSLESLTTEAKPIKETAQVRLALARARTKLGVAFTALDRNIEAEDVFGKAAAEYESLRLVEGFAQRSLAELIQTYQELRDISLRFGRSTEADKLDKLAKAALDQLYQLEPKNIEVEQAYLTLSLSLSPEQLQKQTEELEQKAVGGTVTRELKKKVVESTRVPPTSSVAETPAHIFGFRLLQKVGIGGFGEVWKALDTTVDRVVAIKKQRAGRSHHGFEDNLIAEGRILAQLDHPNILPLLSCGRDHEGPFLVLKYVEGQSLSDALRQAPLESRHAATLLMLVCRALQHAHEKQILHGDVKPDNILLNGADQWPLLTDWLMGAVAANSHEKGHVVGTPAYMSPEAAIGGNSDGRSDVFCAGITLFESLTGKRPWAWEGDGRSSIGEYIRRRIEGEPFPDTQALYQSVPQPLFAICAKAMRHKPDERYQSAGEMADDLDRWLKGKRINAQNESLFDTVRRFAQKTLRRR